MSVEKWSNVAPVTLDVRVPGNQTTKALNLSNPPVLQAPKQVGPLGAIEFDGLGRGGDSHWLLGWAY